MPCCQSLPGRLPELQFQVEAPGLPGTSVCAGLVAGCLGGRKAAIRAELDNQGIATGAYFSPHLTGAAILPQNFGRYPCQSATMFPQG